jgi:hypothetical protein
VEKTPTLHRGRESVTWLVRIHVLCIAGPHGGSGDQEGDAAHSFEFSNCARTAIVGDDSGRYALCLISPSPFVSLSLQIRETEFALNGRAGSDDGLWGILVMSSVGSAGGKGCPQGWGANGICSA